MVDVSTTLYIFIAVYAAGLLSPFLTAERGQIIAATSVYRPFCLGLILVHCTTSVFSSAHSILGVLANASYIVALVLITRELRDDQKLIFKRNAFIDAVILLLVVSCVMFLGRLLLVSDRAFASLIIVTAMLAELAIIAAIYSNYRRSKSIYLVHAMVAAFASLLIMLARVVLVNEQTKYAVGFGNESELLLWARLVNAAACFVLLGAITNYHFQKLWNKERHLRVEAERRGLDGLLAMAQARDNEAGNNKLRKKKYVAVLTDNLQSKGRFRAPVPNGPDDIANQNVSRSAELMALAEVYDVLTNRRPGKQTWPTSRLLCRLPIWQAVGSTTLSSTPSLKSKTHFWQLQNAGSMMPMTLAWPLIFRFCPRDCKALPLRSHCHAAMSINNSGRVTSLPLRRR